MSAEIAAALGGSVIGGLFGMAGQNSANKTNIKLAREDREWQERMSNTAYQRSAKDLEQAGLNRILSLGSPASSPAGRVATVQSTTQQMAANATNLASQVAQINKTMAETDAINQNVKIKEPLETVRETVMDGVNWIKNYTSGVDFDKIGQSTQSSAKSKTPVGGVPKNIKKAASKSKIKEWIKQNKAEHKAYVEERAESFNNSPSSRLIQWVKETFMSKAPKKPKPKRKPYKSRIPKGARIQ